MPARKRAASGPVAGDPERASTGPPRRRSGRVSSTPKKSVYFDDGSDDENADYDDDFEDESEEEEQEDDADEFTDNEEEDEKPPRKRGRGRPSTGSGGGGGTNVKKRVNKPTGLKKQHASGEEDDEDDEDDEDTRPRVEIIPLEQMRPLDGVEYEDEKLHKNTLLFLRDLKANNQRPWLKSHDGEYRRALQDWNTFVESFTSRIVEADFTVPELPSKDVIFRIHRDVRFSKDPTPYKPHFSAAWSRTGRKGPYACYYVHVEPGGHCFVGGGLWCPPGEQVHTLRASIDERPARWRRVLNEERFRKTFLDWRMKEKEKKKQSKRKGTTRRKSVGAKGSEGDEGDEKDQEAAVLAFAMANQSNALKTKPKDYSADHRDIELLKLRNYTIGTKVDDGLFTKDDVQDKLMEIIEAMVPFITFLNRIVMPDPTEDSSDEEGGEEEENTGDANGDGAGSVDDQDQMSE